MKIKQKYVSVVALVTMTTLAVLTGCQQSEKSESVVESQKQTDNNAAEERAQSEEKVSEQSKGVTAVSSATRGK